MSGGRGALAGRTSVVSGASGGIGRATAVALAAQGARLCLLGRDRDRLDRVQSEVRAAGGPPPIAVVGDLTDADHVTEVVATVEQRFGGLDLLALCAGEYRRADVGGATLRDLDELYRANVRAPFQLIQLLLPALAKNKGDVVLVNSTQGTSATAGLGQYAATQHSTKALADSLRAEVNSDGIRVTTLHIGRTATALQERIFAGEGRAYRPESLIQPADVAQLIVTAVTLPKQTQLINATLWPTERA